MDIEKYKRAVLAAMPATQLELRERLRIGKDTSRLVLQQLRAAGQCHIGSYKHVGKKPSRVYHAGPGKDAKPLPYQKQEPQAEGGVRRDPLVAAFFGPA